MPLREPTTAIGAPGGAEGREGGVSGAFELGALVAAGGVFDGEFVQVEGFLQGV